MDGSAAACDTASALPCAGHFRICSPLAELSYAEQLARKHAELEGLLGPIERFVPAAVHSGYRKKIEYSFYADDAGLSLAFFERGGKGMAKLPHGCALASAKMNAVAGAIVRVLGAEGVAKRTLKSLIVLESKADDARIAALFVKDVPFPLSAHALAERAGVENFLLVHSDYRSPASVVTDILGIVGETTLRENVFGASLTYPFDGFFQNNIPVFEAALAEMARWVEPSARLVDAYCGVGTIGIALSGHVDSVLGIETHAGMAEAAAENARRNGVRAYAAVAGSAEAHMRGRITNDDIVLVDPPRSGLHGKAVAALNDALPRRIIYLSCNPTTQARDLSLIRGYRMAQAVGFDMYPGTLHMESLVVLDRLQ